MNKVTVVGAGFVGATAAYALLLQGVAPEICLVDVKKEKAQGEALDLEHGMQFMPGAKITYGDSYDLCAGSDVVVVTAGLGQKPGETRMELVEKNAAIFKEIIPRIAHAAPNCVLLIISNPVDVLTYLAIKYSGFPKERVFGSGTTLDTARFRYYLSEQFGVNAQSIHAYILGEHGDTEFPALNIATAAGLPLKDLNGYSKEVVLDAFKKTKNAAYEIIAAKGATYYAIGLVISQLVRAILNDEHRVYPVSTYLDNYYDEGNLCMSVPCAIGKGGIQKKFQLPLSAEEQQWLHTSARAIKETIAPYK